MQFPTESSSRSVYPLHAETRSGCTVGAQRTALKYERFAPAFASFGVAGSEAAAMGATDEALVLAERAVLVWREFLVVVWRSEMP